MEYELLMKRTIDRPYQLDSSTILRCFSLKKQFFLGGPQKSQKPAEENYYL